MKRRGATTTTITAITKLLLHMHLCIICMFVCVDGKNSAEIFHCKVTQAARGSQSHMGKCMYICMCACTIAHM